MLYQANYTGFNKEYEPKNYEKLYYDYEQPKRMSAALKMANLYEQMEKYDSAEITLLNQVKENRKAGFARQAQIDKGLTGVTKSSVNLFWLLANEDLEAATYNFYNRMLAKFPRDGVWYKNAGQFLYERLLLSYKQIPLKEQKYFYTYSLENPYPFRGGEEGSDPSPETVKARKTITNQFELPATGEKMNIDMKIYDPLLSAVNYIKLAIRYSGESIPEAKLLLELAHLNSWMGNTDEAINNFQNYLTQQPNDVTVRNEFINYLNFNQQFVAESNQLNILNKNNNLNNNQFLKLANYKILSNEYSDANLLLKNFKPNNTADSNSLINNNIQIFIKEKNYEKAISLLKDSLNFKIKEANQAEMEATEQTAEIEKYYNSIYTQIRLYAFLKNNKAAISLLKELLDSGAVNEKVLIYDPLLNNIRKKRSWKRLLSKFDLQHQHLPAKQDDENLWRSSLDYRIPKKK